MPQKCRARYSHVCLALLLDLDVLVWRLCYRRSFSSPLSLASHLLLHYWSWRSDLHPQVEVVDVSWNWGSLHARQHAEDPAMFTWHPHFSQRNVENMGLHHVHPQEAPSNGENGLKCSIVVFVWFCCCCFFKKICFHLSLHVALSKLKCVLHLFFRLSLIGSNSTC